MIYLIGIDNGDGINWLWVILEREPAFDKFKTLLDGRNYHSRNVGRYVIYHDQAAAVVMVSIDILKHGRLSLGTVAP